MELVLFLVSIVITYFILKVINRNTIGTTNAYIERAVMTWGIVFALLAAFFGLI